MEPIIEIKNIGKKYNITHQKGGYITLRDVLTNAFKNPFSFLKTKTKQIIGMETKEEFWALKDINFSVEKGEVIGIIGRNGVGKSTLLKILSQITPPTTGEIKIHGTVGSLLEVGTGFHPELTGRENIFLNGAILGMKNKDIIKKFNDIVEFAGIEKFLDTPVKHYSSGMYVRLAFSVAAHMETDILIIDEVLAVGDAEFQKKCLGKMNEITKKEGRTILFVSHNMSAIKQLCQRCLLLDKGAIVKSGNTSEVLDFYLFKNDKLQSVFNFPIQHKNRAEITKISILSENNQPSAHFPANAKINIEFEYNIYEKINHAVCGIFLYSTDGDLLLYSSDGELEGRLLSYEPGIYRAIIEIPPLMLNSGHYNFTLAIHEPFIENIESKEKITFEITNHGNPKSIILNGNAVGKLSSSLNFTKIKINQN